MQNTKTQDTPQTERSEQNTKTEEEPQTEEGPQTERSEQNTKTEEEPRTERSEQNPKTEEEPQTERSEQNTDTEEGSQTEQPEQNTKTEEEPQTERPEQNPRTDYRSINELVAAIHFKPSKKLDQDNKVKDPRDICLYSIEPDPDSDNLTGKILKWDINKYKVYLATECEECHFCPPLPYIRGRQTYHDLYVKPEKNWICEDTFETGEACGGSYDMTALREFKKGQPKDEAELFAARFVLN